MNISESQSRRRAWVTANYASVALFLGAFIVAERTGWTPALIAIVVAGLLFAIGTFVAVYWKTGLWKLVHARDEDLDERQRQVTRDALRHAYAAFTVVTLLLLMYFALKYQDWGIIVLAVLIYFAHIVPASIIAWKEKVV